MHHSKAKYIKIQTAGTRYTGVSVNYKLIASNNNIVYKFHLPLMPLFQSPGASSTGI